MTEQTIAHRLLQTHYGLRGTLEPLPGDVDSNFKVEATDGRTYVLKLMHPACQQEALDSQCAALYHLADCPLVLPRIIPNRQGQAWRRVEVDGTDRLLWMLGYCPGTLLAGWETRNAILHRSFGTVLATLDQSLAGFTHPGMKPGHRWQISQAAQSAALLPTVAEPYRQRLAEIFERFRQEISPSLKILPHSVIHNDANDHNVLVDDSGRVSGLFDFGDMAWEPRVCESAIALAYLMMDQADPVAVLRDYLIGYCEVLPLDESERSLLWPLIETRLAVSIAISSQRQLQEPDNEYLVVSQAPAKALLDRMAEVSPDRAEQAVSP